MVAEIQQGRHQVVAHGVGLGRDRRGRVRIGRHRQLVLQLEADPFGGALADAGIPTGLSIAPIIPGLNDDDIPELLDRAYGAGARTATYSLLRLSGSLEPVFLDRIGEAFPERIGKITNRLREVRGGTLTESRFFTRQAGQGPYWEVIEQLFALAKRRAGFPEDNMSAIPQTFRRPGVEQGSLF